MRFIHTADIHIGKAFSASHFGKDFATLRREELIDTFTRLIDYANHNHIDFILIAGDMLHSDDVSMEELRNINDIISRLNTKIIAVSGNHDPINKQSIYHRIDWCEKILFANPGLDKITMPEFNLDLYTYSWTTHYMDTDALDDIEISDRSKVNILLAHGDLLTNSNFMPVNKKALIDKGFDYVAMGHVHKPQFIWDNIAYAGSLEPLDSGEYGEHGFILCEIDEQSKKKNFIFTGFSKRRYLEVAVPVEASYSDVKITEKILESLNSQPLTNVPRITLTGYRKAGTVIDCGTIVKALQNAGRYGDVVDCTMPDYDLESIYKENMRNIIGTYIARFGDVEQLDTVKKKALFYGLDALLSQRGDAK